MQPQYTTSVVKRLRREVFKELNYIKERYGRTCLMFAKMVEANPDAKDTKDTIQMGRAFLWNEVYGVWYEEVRALLTKVPYQQ